MAEASGSLHNIPRGGACSNCRRRKVRCDGARPICSQCRTRPPRSGDPCLFDQEASSTHQTPAQMQGTIKALTSRVKDLERSGGFAPSPVPLLQPYDSSSRRGTPAPPEEMHSPPNFQEPPKDILRKVLTTFFERFTNSGYFFLEPGRFSTSALLPLPFGHLNRPSPSLLSTIYLWGCILASTLPRGYSEDTFLLSALQHLPSDIRGFAAAAPIQGPKLVLDTIQAEVLLSLYYLHAALPVQGRYHAAVAASLALSAGLHQLHVPMQDVYPPFVLAEQLLPPPSDGVDAAERVGAFWSVVIVNNCWVAADGCPSAIPYGTAVDTPWPSGSKAGATISKFLSGHDLDGYTSFALMAKASTLLERICSTVGRGAAIDPNSFTALDNRLHTFQSSLPPPNTERALILAHALVDTAILRLHAPHARASNTARFKVLDAAGRIALRLSDAGVLTGDDPIYGPVCSNVCSVYNEQLSLLRTGAPTPQARAQYQELEQRLGLVLNVMTRLARSSPVMQRCLSSSRPPTSQ